MEIITRVSDFADILTTGAQQYAESREYWKKRDNFKQNQYKHEHYLRNLDTLVCFFLSGNGCKTIGINDGVFLDNLFKKGIRDVVSREYLNIKRKSIAPDWLRHFKGGDGSIDFMVLIADNFADRLEEAGSSVINYFERLGVARYLFREDGKMLRNKSGKVIEPFGFRDGISRVSMFSEKTKQLSLSRSKVVLNDHGGSFMVFLKLQQHVDQFDKKVEFIRSQLFKHNSDPKEIEKQRKFVEAQFIGRFKDGTPLELFPEPVLEGSKLTREQEEKIKKFNSYTATEEGLGYQEDPPGGKCPFHAHIRKMNPRQPDVINQAGMENYSSDGKKRVPLRLVRRGIPYSEKGSGGEEVGLLFMSYQARIRDHFSIVIKQWANEKTFPANPDSLMPGLDPIIGRGKGAAKNRNHWNPKWNSKSPKPITADFRDLVSLRGGEYFYAPSVTTLKKLKEQTSST